MRVLFLHHNQPDYLIESLFHGLRTLLGFNCVDVPRYDSMYSPLDKDLASRKLAGNGFTLFGLLPDQPALATSRYFWRKDFDSYDLFVVAPAWQQWHLLAELIRLVGPKRVVTLDGEDFPGVFPYRPRSILKPCTWWTPNSRCLTFKRELMENGGWMGAFANVLPRGVRRLIKTPRRLRPINFSIPSSKIFTGESARTRDFQSYLVDKEVAVGVLGKYTPVGSNDYVFQTEESYYRDLQSSKFGVTTKRAGWDCLRHYELAANGCVLCFRDLHLKPRLCAPHGLNEYNCVSYRNYRELRSKIDAFDSARLLIFQQNTRAWIRQNTTELVARRFLDEIGNSWSSGFTNDYRDKRSSTPLATGWNENIS